MNFLGFSTDTRQRPVYFISAIRYLSNLPVLALNLLALLLGYQSTATILKSAFPTSNATACAAPLCSTIDAIDGYILLRQAETITSCNEAICAAVVATLSVTAIANILDVSITTLFKLRSEATSMRGISCLSIGLILLSFTSWVSVTYTAPKLSLTPLAIGPDAFAILVGTTGVTQIFSIKIIAFGLLDLAFVILKGSRN